jgi:tetratricopeptide (TPR) repeat protein
VNDGQVQRSLRSGHLALELSKESKNGWAHITSTLGLTQGLLDAGEYEETLVLTQDAVALMRTLPLIGLFARMLTVLGSVYQALQQWEEARSTLAEAEATAETLGLGLLRVPILSRLCMHYALAGEWEAALRYAVKASALRKSTDTALIAVDFYSQYETEAFLRGGNERQAREAVHRLGECLGPSRRFRIPYLQSLAALAAWEGRREQAISHLREAAGLAADLGLLGEQWQIQAALGRVYEAGGEPAQAHKAWAEAARMIGGLAEGIKDEALRTRFLVGPQIHPVLQHVQGEASPVLTDQAEPGGR